MELISAKTLLLVEGQDEKTICELLLRKIAPDFESSLDVENAGGGDDLFSKASALDVRANFGVLSCIAIVCDAEENPTATANKWSAFKQDFEAKHKGKTCEVIILPSEQQAGAIDSVFLSSLDAGSNPIAACALSLAACVGSQGAQTTQARRDKLALTSYINAHTKNPYARVGKAVQQDARDLFDFGHQSFKPLTDFLRKLV